MLSATRNPRLTKPRLLPQGAYNVMGNNNTCHLQHLLCTSDCTKCFTYITSLTSHEYSGPRIVVPIIQSKKLEHRKMKYWLRPHNDQVLVLRFLPCGSDSKATFSLVDHSIFHLLVIHQLPARDRIRQLNAHVFGTAAKRC